MKGKTMKNPLLSICIPTYNRCNELNNLLLSICSQIQEEFRELIEITVSDNASTDATQDMVTEFISIHSDKKIIYDRNTENLGADRNYLKAVSLAHGKYAWIMGSDDELKPNALTKIMDQLKSKDTIYISGRDIYYRSFNGKKSRTQFFYKPYYVEKNWKFEFRNIRDWDIYFNSCVALGAVFSYLSAIIFDKDEWDKVVVDDSYVGTAYIHVYVLLSMLIMSQNSSLRVLPNALVKTRFGNDSFSSNDYNRLMIDFVGYEKLADLFEDDILKDDFLDIVRRENKTVAGRLILKANKKQINELTRRMTRIGYPKEYINLVKRMHRYKITTFFLYRDKWKKFLLGSK